MSAYSGLSDLRERRLISRSMASRMNSAMRLGPTMASIAARVSTVSLTSVGFVSDFLLSGGRPIRAAVSDIGISVKFVSNVKIKRYRLLTVYPISVISSITNWIGDMDMAKNRYALRIETRDGTLEDPFHTMTRKADAVRAAKKAAKDFIGADIVRVWVDDLCTDLGIASFKTNHADRVA